MKITIETDPRCNNIEIVLEKDDDGVIDLVATESEDDDRFELVFSENEALQIADALVTLAGKG